MQDYINRINLIFNTFKSVSINVEYYNGQEWETVIDLEFSSKYEAQRYLFNNIDIECGNTTIDIYNDVQNFFKTNL